MMFFKMSKVIEVFEIEDYKEIFIKLINIFFFILKLIILMNVFIFFMRVIRNNLGKYLNIYIFFLINYCLWYKDINVSFIFYRYEIIVFVC